ncbi:MAG: GNAT family N-acetyltransferase [Hyphomicrobiales bacterium]|nr:GNAT family N-acetyltransferase [Hyphomicrobiales bacterium]
MKSLVLRAPAPGERTALLDLWVAAWDATFPDIDFDARRDWLTGHLAKIEASGAKTICAFDDDRPLGFVTIDPATGWLDQIAVHPDFFGTGVATKLLAAAKRISPARVKLDVNADNFRALRFYRREQFIRTGASVNALSGRETVVLEWRGGEMTD